MIEDTARETPRRLEHRMLGASKLEVTALGLGTAGIGGVYGPVSEDEAIAVVRRAVQAGINFIDTSPKYLESERRIGLALQGGLRERVILSSKTGTHPNWSGDYSADATRRSLESSLKTLNTDWIDLLLIHDPPNLEQTFAAGGALEALEDLKSQGIICAIGLGVRDHGLHREAITSGRFDAVLTYLDYTPLRTTAIGLLELAQEHRVGVINGSPLAMGLLGGTNPREHFRSSMGWAGSEEHWTELGLAEHLWHWSLKRGVSLPALALQFSLREKRFASTLVGAKNLIELEATLKASKLHFPEALWQELETVRQEFKPKESYANHRR